MYTKTMCGKIIQGVVHLVNMLFMLKRKTPGIQTQDLAGKQQC